MTVLAPLITNNIEMTLNEHVAEIRRLGKRVVLDVVEIGRRLSECRRIIDHGEWLPWLDREFGWSDRTALNYIRAYEVVTKSEIVSDLDLSMTLGALYLLGAPSTPAEVQNDILQRAKGGEQIKVGDVKDAIEEAKPAKRTRAAKVETKGEETPAQIEAARERAKRLGREVVQDGRKLKLIALDPRRIIVVCHSVKKLNEALDKIEAENSVKPPKTFDELCAEAERMGAKLSRCADRENSYALDFGGGRRRGRERRCKGLEQAQRFLKEEADKRAAHAAQMAALERKWAEEEQAQAGAEKPPIAANVEAFIEEVVGISGIFRGADAADDDESEVEDPKVVAGNILDTIEHHKELARVFRKFCKLSSFDHETKKQLHEGIEVLIAKWRLVQTTLKKDDPKPPSGPSSGSKPEGEPEPKDTTAPAETAPTETVPHPDCPACAGSGLATFQQQTCGTGEPIGQPIGVDCPLCKPETAAETVPPPEQTAPQPIPISPPTPAPAPTPTPTPSPPKPQLAFENWERISVASELELVICKTGAFGVEHGCEEQLLPQMQKMRERLTVLRKADRAERPQAKAEAHAR
jgi:Protein of unknown function (DUF3102)